MNRNKYAKLTYRAKLTLKRPTYGRARLWPLNRTEGAFMTMRFFSQKSNICLSIGIIIYLFTSAIRAKKTCRLVNRLGKSPLT